MKEKKVNSSISKLDILAAYQILGGLLGIGLTVYLIISASEISLAHVVVISIASLLYGYSFVCGIVMLRKITTGLKLSRINQLLQVFSFFVFGYGFQYVSGILLSIGIDLSQTFEIKFNTSLSILEINFNSDPGISIVNFNIVALVILIFIERQLKEINAEHLKDTISEIGEVIV